MGSLIWRFSAFHASKLLLLTAQSFPLGKGVLNKFLYGGGGGLRPEVQPLTHFSRQEYPFRIPSIEKWYPFRERCLELCIPFINCCKCTVV